MKKQRMWAVVTKRGQVVECNRSWHKMDAFDRRDAAYTHCIDYVVGIVEVRIVKPKPRRKTKRASR